MNWRALIDQRAAEALAEIRQMAAQAQAEVAFRFSRLNRSAGQKRRYARAKGKMK